MGGFSAQVQEPQTSQPQGKGSLGNQMADPVVNASSQIQQSTTGKGEGPSAGYAQNAINDNSQVPQQPQYQQQSMGKGGNVTNSSTSGQPRMGQPNQYPNTVGQWDNARIQSSQSGGGKGKG